MSCNSQRGTRTKQEKWLPNSCKQKYWGVKSSLSHANHRIRVIWGRKRPHKVKLSVPVWWHILFVGCTPALNFLLTVETGWMIRCLKDPTRSIFPVWQWMDLITSLLVHKGLKNYPKLAAMVFMLLLHGIQMRVSRRMGLLKVRRHIYFFPKPCGHVHHQQQDVNRIPWKPVLAALA